MKTEQMEEIIQTVLHSIRSLMCTATNATPCERMFSHPRRSYNGFSIHTRLTKPDPVLIKRETTRSEGNKGAEENLPVHPDLQPIRSDSTVTLGDSTEENMNTLALRTAGHRQPPVFLKNYIRN
ncbi:hypothetical protein TNCV_135801 [Trichonephila clavipes]|nr:hypothetical protein TNCV_135801 [Trichonephila clavipes]